MKTYILLASLLIGAGATAVSAQPAFRPAVTPAVPARAAVQRAALEERMAQRQLDLLVGGIVGDGQERATAARLAKLSLVDFRR